MEPVPEVLCPISTVIITRNEADRLERCVRSCREFSDEVLVVDSHSTDATREVAHRLGCRVIENGWPGYSAQRNFGAGEAAHDWIFSIDADEEPDEELRRALAGLRRVPPGDRPAHSIHRINSFMGAWLTESPEVIVRLYDRRRTGYSAAIVHEVVDVPVADTRTLPGYVWHENHVDLEDATRRLDLYTSLEADREAGKREMQLWRLFLRPVLRFGQRYLLQRSFQHGWRGLFLAFHWTYWELLREMKVYERRRGGPDRGPRR
jgi:glycosyltransferase involved in cell wall biosynthesis